MVVVDLNATNSTFYDSETVLNIVYECSSVYLAFVIIVGIGLNSKALSLLIRANQVRYNYFWRQVLHPHLIYLCENKLSTNAELCLFQVRKTEQNFMLINLIGSEILIAFALPLDFLGSITQGKLYEGYPFLCPVGGFVHTFLGNKPFLY